MTRLQASTSIICIRRTHPSSFIRMQFYLSASFNSTNILNHPDPSTAIHAFIHMNSHLFTSLLFPRNLSTFLHNLTYSSTSMRISSIEEFSIIYTPSSKSIDLHSHLSSSIRKFTHINLYPCNTSIPMIHIHHPYWQIHSRKE